MERDEISVEGVRAEVATEILLSLKNGLADRRTPEQIADDAATYVMCVFAKARSLALSERVAKIGGDYSRFSKKLADDGLWDLLNEGSEREREAAEWIKALHDEVATLTQEGKR